MTAHTANGKATTPRKAPKQRAAKTAKASPDQAPKTPQPGRDAHGKFQRGNTGGVGNPYARQVAILRRELMETTSPTDIRNIGLKLKALALEGNVQAAKLIFAYNLGLPTAPESPDREHFDELRLFLDEAKLMAVDGKNIPATGALRVLLRAWRLQRRQNGYNQAKGAAGHVTATPAEHKAVAHLPPAERQKAYAHCGIAKDWPAFPQSHWYDIDWIPWPNEAKDAATQTPPEPSSAAPNGATSEVNPSANGSNGKHAAAESRVAAPQRQQVPTKPAPSTNGSNGKHAAAESRVAAPQRQQGRTKPAPSRNGVIGARSKYALLPKSMRPKGVIVPRF